MQNSRLIWPFKYKIKCQLQILLLLSVFLKHINVRSLDSVGEMRRDDGGKLVPVDQLVANCEQMQDTIVQSIT